MQTEKKEEAIFGSSIIIGKNFSTTSWDENFRLFTFFTKMRRKRIEKLYLIFLPLVFVLKINVEF